MKNFLGITIALATMFSFQTVTANCGKTSAFRFEFESWLRRYTFDVIGRLSEGIEHIFTITLSELELEEEQEILFENELTNWHDFSRKLLIPKTDVAEILKEFRLKIKDFHNQRDVLAVLATKNMDKAMNELDNLTEIMSQEYANEILMDWKIFRLKQDFETLAQQEDCKLINDIMENLRRSKNKEMAMVDMFRVLCYIFDMQKWLVILSSSKENSVY